MCAAHLKKRTSHECSCFIESIKRVVGKEIEKILSFFATSSINSIKQDNKMIDSVYHMTLRIV